MVITDDAQSFAEQMGIQLFETSAKENHNVEEVSNLLEDNLIQGWQVLQYQSSHLDEIGWEGGGGGGRG